MRAHGDRAGYPTKTGLYTSPHLIWPEERIRINSEPLQPALFAKYFFEVYEKLPQLSKDFDPAESVVERGPRYLQLFALFALHVFIRERVDVAIIETHNGGEFDATNVVSKPVVTAITSLGMDHVDSLGPSIENIAWHKSGIYKQGAAALSTVQDSGSTEVLLARAVDAGEEIKFVHVDERLPLDDLKLKPEVQRKNASLAVAVAEAFLKRRGNEEPRTLSRHDLRIGVRKWSWPGRYQIIEDSHGTWFLDAAHNEMSIGIATRWFIDGAAELGNEAKQYLIFSHISESRDAVAILQALANAFRESGAKAPSAIFTTYDETEASPASSAMDLSPFVILWKTAFPKANTMTPRTVRNAIDCVRKIATEHPTTKVQTLITGSQHLVGPALKILQEP